jgi:hypothetical protein
LNLLKYHEFPATMLASHMGRTMSRYTSRARHHQKTVLPIVICFILLLLGLTIVPMAFARQSQRFALPKDKPYVHQPSGFEFPVRMKSFQRGVGQRYDEAGLDVSINYNDTTSRAWADVYVYPNQKDASPQQELKNVEAGLGKVPNYSNVRILEDGPYKLEQGNRVFLGMHGTFSYTIEKDGNKEAMRSQAFVFVIGGNFIQFRITYPQAQAEAAEKALDAFVHELKLPEAPGGK